MSGEDKVFNIPIKRERGIGIMTHALCNLQEIISYDSGYFIQATYCKDHGLFMVWNNGESVFSEKGDEG